MDAPSGTVTSEEACRILGVRKATLYSYASRGRIRRVNAGRRRYYIAADVQRIADRAAARRGHTAVAVGALRWGEPVLDSAITCIRDGGIYYRGTDVCQLAQSDTPFEQVAELFVGK